jgi:hypothetical protein
MRATPRTLADLEGDDLKIILTFRSLPPHRRPAMLRFLICLRNDVPTAKAERLCRQQIAIADARLACGTKPAGEIVRLGKAVS